MNGETARINGELQAPLGTATAKPKEPSYPVSHRDLTRQVLTKLFAVAVHPAVSLFAIRLIRDELLTFLRFSAASAAPGFAIPITETIR